jgi:hypothetical protein
MPPSSFAEDLLALLYFGLPPNWRYPKQVDGQALCLAALLTSGQHTHMPVIILGVGTAERSPSRRAVQCRWVTAGLRVRRHTLTHAGQVRALDCFFSHGRTFLDKGGWIPFLIAGSKDRSFSAARLTADILLAQVKRNGEPRGFPFASLCFCTARSARDAACVHRSSGVVLSCDWS